MTAEEGPPPWVWDHLDDEAYAETWNRFAAWVGWLEKAYGEWVALPPCWPLHEALRTELIFFWYWHRWLMTACYNPTEGPRWHGQLRTSALAWQALRDCSHEAPIHYQEQLDAQRSRRHAEFRHQAMTRPPRG